MTIRLRIDEDVDPDVAKCLRLRAPDIDIRDGKLEAFEEPKTKLFSSLDLPKTAWL